MSNPSVFISYRRDPSSDLARYIRRELSDAGASVFLDVEDIDKGRFENVISAGIENADSFLLLLAPETLKSEWVRKEVNLALDLGKNIVLLMMPDFSMEKHVPEEMSALRRLHGIPYNHHYAEAALEKVKKAIGLEQPSTAPVASPRRGLGWRWSGITVLALVLLGLLAIYVANKPPTPVPTDVAIMQANTSATEIASQRTVDAQETINAALMPDDNRAAVAIIQLDATGTELMLQLTIVAQQINLATREAENTLIPASPSLVIGNLGANLINMPSVEAQVVASVLDVVLPIVGQVSTNQGVYYYVDYMGQKLWISQIWGRLEGAESQNVPQIPLFIIGDLGAVLRTEPSFNAPVAANVDKVQLPVFGRTVNEEGTYYQVEYDGQRVWVSQNWGRLEGAKSDDVPLLESNTQ
jgi:hypothetical protein